jgi:hypothetical protein
MKGEITVTSQVSRGSIFSLILPNVQRICSNSQISDGIVPNVETEFPHQDWLSNTNRFIRQANKIPHNTNSARTQDYNQIIIELVQEE